MKFKIKKIFGLLFFIIFFAQIVDAQSAPVNAYFFYGEGCPHCAQERQYLFHSLKSEYPDLEIYEYEIYKNRSNTALLQEVSYNLGVNVEGVPFLVIGDQHFVGYADGITSEAIKQKVSQCSMVGCVDPIASIVGIIEKQTILEDIKNLEVVPLIEKHGETQIVPNGSDIEVQNKKIINLPILGEVDVVNFSLPVLTIVMGALDGFNPCAMWTLLFLISLLLGMNDRKRMWIFGTVFIIASASVYFLFMSAWLNLILFLGFVIWVRILIGILALFGGCYNLKEFIFNKNSGCKVSGNEKRQKTFEKMKMIIQQSSLLLGVGGIIVLAFAVNLVELICSAGLPAVYTQILALNEMSSLQYYLYILIYIFFFMLDDLFIFFVAMITLEMTGITTKYSRVSRLVGGLIMLVIGLMLIFKPGWLMF
jgi:glutaredoxin